MPTLYHLVISPTTLNGVLPCGKASEQFGAMPTQKPAMHDAMVERRRKRLRQWIDEHFGGLQTTFIAATNDGEKQLNQGELSGLLRTKSFGEKRARSLEIQARMPVGYLDSEDAPLHQPPGNVHKGTSLATDQSTAPRHEVREQSAWELSDLERKMIKMFRSLSDTGQAEALDILEYLTKKHPRTFKPTGSQQCDQVPGAAKRAA